MRALLLLVVAGCGRTTETTHITGGLPCGSMANASTNGIVLSAIDRTGRNIDLCPRMDAALSKVRDIARYRNHGYKVVGELSKMTIKGDTTTCSLRFEVVAPASRIASGGAKVRGAPADVAYAIDDCVTAVVEDVFVKRVFP
jgi:hypothetical protein